MKLSIRSLIRNGTVIVGSDWEADPDAPENSPVKGHRYAGKALFVNTSDLFYWGVADGIKLPDDCSEIEKAIEECDGDVEVGFLLWAAREQQMRPQGAYYKMFPIKTWGLFNECGPYRETDFGNPHEIPDPPGETT